MVFNSWVELTERCPIDIGRLNRYANDFNSNVSVKITVSNVNKAKEYLLEARSNLDSMFILFVQLIYDEKIIKENTDIVMFGWLKDDLGRYLKYLDEREKELMIDWDDLRQKDSLVGISRLSSYAKTLKIAANSVIYESLLKSINEYNENDKKELRVFLYILFKVFQATLSMVGAITREKISTKRGVVNTLPTTLPTNVGFLMSNKGQELIKDRFKEETGKELEDLDFEDIEDEDTEDEEID